MKTGQCDRICVSALTVAVIAVLMFLLGAAALGDVLTLKSGQVLEGKVAQSTDVVTVTTANATIIYKKDEVASIAPGPTAADVYTKRAAEIKDGDAEGHYQLGLFAESKGLLKAAAGEYAKAVAADPNHAAARAKLGYILDNGSWISRDEILARKGLAADKSRSVTADEAEELKAADREVTRSRNEYKLVRFLVEAVKSSRGQAKIDAEEKLAGVSSPVSLGPLIGATNDADTDVRTAAVRALGNYREDKAALALLDTAVNDPVSDIRYRARTILGKKHNETVFREAVRLVSSGEDVARFHAAEVLGALGDGRAVPSLIDNLSWTRNNAPPAPAPQQSARQAQINTVGPQYVGGLSVTEAPHVKGTAPAFVSVNPTVNGFDRYGNRVTTNQTNDAANSPPRTGASENPAPTYELILNNEALAALKALTGQDFRFDMDAWRQWYQANSSHLKTLSGGIVPGN